MRFDGVRFVVSIASAPTPFMDLVVHLNEDPPAPVYPPRRLTVLEGGRFSHTYCPADG